MKKALQITTTLLGVCALSLFTINCGGDHDHDHDGHDHDHGEEHKEEGAGHDHDGADHDGKEHAGKESGESAAATPAKDTYPLKTCVVSGEELGSMGEPFVIVHEGTTVKFCCDGCVDDFKKDPAPFLAKLAAATKVK